MKTSFLNIFSTYRELIQTGGIQSSAVGEFIFLDIKGNLAGDVLIFIGPITGALSADADIEELIQSDNKLELQRSLAFKAFRYKYRGLALLPESIVWMINTGISVFYVYLNSNRILGLFAGEINLAEILSMMPLLVMAVITPFIGRAFGLKLMKPFVSLIIWIIKSYRKAIKRKVS